MKYTKYISFYLPILLICLSSCGKVVDESMPWQLQSLPVAFSVISPDNAVRVSLSQTIVKGQKQDTIYYPTAKVFVAGEDNNWVELTRQSYEKAVYTDTAWQIKVEQGRNYYLRVELPNAALAAQTTVPVDKAEILEARCIIDGNSGMSGWNGDIGTLSARVKLPGTNKCVLMYDSYKVGESVFLSSESIVTNYFSVPNDSASIKLQLLTFDTYLEKYYLAAEISSYPSFHDGDISVMLGAFNGLMPPYSNIENGVGLFASYVSDRKTITIERK